MPNRPRPEEALDFLRAELATGQSEMTEWTTRGAWLAFVRFGRWRFDTAATPDSDGLLFQYGTYAFSGRPMFTVGLTRQFDVTDDDGEHDHYVQVHCELRYEAEPDLDALGSFDSWFFTMPPPKITASTPTSSRRPPTGTRASMCAPTAPTAPTASSSATSLS
ncbi:hypothetical protein KBP30_01450 [Streptomyces sp. Go40/10]|uniref:hypothetical protein n=1 Tax=Streptomyces sp. Go40/10 TaxID=2825844 RepID=UPI001E563234|nr:hypothetical protein [Streptomyces sp. Go40/10]UFQ99954.1 hypothetical protein KBP30_01450 [Streptomyces sp. Go40/10]